MNKLGLTLKQENFCQAYIRLGDKSAAYREAYDASKMKSDSVNRKAVELFENGKITARIAELQNEARDRNNVSVDDIVKALKAMMQFDIGTLYDEDNNLLPIHKIPKEARLMIQHLDTDHLFAGKDLIGATKKVKTYSKMDAIEKLMKHLGGYEKDNQQQKTDTTVILNLGVGTPELPTG